LSCPALPTTSDETNRSSTTNSGNDFAKAILNFVHGCDRILQNTQRENEDIFYSNEQRLKQIELKDFPMLTQSRRTN
jgi:hypothetical protein